QRLMIDRDQPSIPQLLEKGPLLAAIDERFARRIDVVHAAAGIVADRAAIGEDFVERHSRAQTGHRLIVDAAELLVDGLEPIVDVIQAYALRHVGDGVLEALSERARRRKSPRQIVADRGQYLRESAAAGARARLSVFGLTPHVQDPPAPAGLGNPAAIRP